MYQMLVYKEARFVGIQMLLQQGTDPSKSWEKSIFLRQVTIYLL